MSLPSITNSPIFNSSFFLGSNDYLTIAVADKRYQKLGGTGVFSSLAVLGNLDCGSLTIAGSIVDLSSLSGVTAGTVTASKLVMVDANKDISSFRNLTATNLIGTLQTAAQPNITSVGTLSSLTVSGSISGTLATASQPNITSVGTPGSLTVSGALNGTLSTAFQSNIASVGTLSSLTVSGNISGTLATASQPNITSLGTLTSLTVSGALNGTLSTASQPNITTVGTLGSLTVSGALNGTLSTAAQPNITSLGTLSSLSLSGGVGIASSGGACDLRTTTANDLYFGANNTRRLAIKSGGNVGVNTTSPGYQLDVSGSLNSTSFYMNGALVTATAADLNGLSGYSSYLSGITPGSVAASKAMVTNSNSVIQFGSGSATTNQIKYLANTSLRDSIRIYRVDDSSPLTIGTQIDGSASTNRTYPILNLVSSIDPTAQIGGVSAASADLLNITWNDKPSVGFTSQTHRFCFNVGNTQPYKTGYPHTFGITTTGDAICIAPNSTTAVPTSGCLYLVSDSITKMMFNTNQPYVGGLGTAPITLQNGNIYLRCSNSLNDGSTSFDTALLVESSNVGAPISFAFQLSNGSSATSTNSVYLGTISSNDLIFMINNTRKITLTAAGRLGIGTSAPSAQLEVSGSVVSTLDVGSSGLAYYLKSGGLVSTLGAGVYTTSDARIKKDITEMDDSIVDGMLKAKPLLYRYKNQGDDVPLQVGYKAQDLIKNGLPHCINFVDVENLPIEDEAVDLENVQFNVDYNSKMVCLLHKVILKQQQQIDELYRKLSDI
ncbi:hypothetical protein PI124_g19387 [Phytophthora idaei]|nr:hypothetical protein PI124_g19387 [Phytophthora idaei]